MRDLEEAVPVGADRVEIQLILPGLAGEDDLPAVR